MYTRLTAFQHHVIESKCQNLLASLCQSVLDVPDVHAAAFAFGAAAFAAATPAAIPT